MLGRSKRSPVVLTMASPGADEAFGGKGAAAALGARGVVRGINVPLRTSAEAAYRLTEFAARFVTPTEMRARSPAEAEEALMKVLTAAQEPLVQPGCLPSSKTFCLERFADSGGQVEQHMPWLEEARGAIGDALAFSEVEAFDHPVAVLSIASTECRDPPNLLRSMYGAPRVPIPLADGTMDSNMDRYYLLVHDPARGTTDQQAVEVLRQCQEALGAAVVVRMLRLAPAEAAGADLAQQGDPIGAYVGDLLSKHLIPYLERRVRAIDHHVSSTRKGMMNVMKNRWRKAADTRDSGGANGGADVAYPAGSSEATLRLAGDLAFMMHDYALAAGHYALLVADYKVDRAWAHLGAAHEARAMSLLQAEPTRREAEAAFLDALEAYRKAPPRPKDDPASSVPAPHASLLSCRAAMALADLYVARGSYREASRELCRSADYEAGPAAGVLRERGALLAARAPQSLRRHAGFHLVLAGFRYAQAGLRAHAMRTYATTQEQFDNKRWRFIYDHIHATLGRHAAHLGDHVLAASHFSKLLGSGHQSQQTQQSFMNEFMYVLKSSRKGEGTHVDELLGTAAAPMALPLPLIDVSRYSVHFQDWRSHDGVGADTIDEATWTSMEDVVPSGEGAGGPTWMDTAAGVAGRKKQAEPTNACVAGEEVTVIVQVHNVTSLPIALTHVRLVCELRHPVEHAAGLGSRKGHVRAASEPVLGHLVGDDMSKVESESELSKMEKVECPEQSVSLLPNERTSLKLRCKPLEHGTMRVLGVEWTLQGEACGRIDFQRPRKGPGSNSKGPSPRRRLAFMVSPPAPRLTCELTGLPSSMLQGQWVRTNLRLTNAGAMGLQGLKLVVEDGAIAQPGKPRDGGDAASIETEMSALSVGEGADEDRVAAAVSSSTILEELALTESAAAMGNKARAFAVLEAEGTLVPGASVHVPRWLRAPANGTSAMVTQRLLLSTLYSPVREADGSLPPLELRRMALRMVRTVDVLPALKCSGAVIASAANAERALLRVDLHNLGTTAISVQQLSVCARGVGCASLVAGERMPAELPPGAATTVLCALGAGDKTGPRSECAVPLLEGAGPGPLSGGPAGELWRRERERVSDSRAGGSGTPAVVTDAAVVWKSIDLHGAQGACAGVSLVRAAAAGSTQCGGVRCTVQAPVSVAHDFASAAMALVACTVRVHNAGSVAARCRLRLLAPPPTVGGAWFAQGLVVSPPRSTPWVWVGRTNVELGELAPGATTETAATLAVLAPGVFDLGSYEVAWCDAGTDGAEEHISKGRPTSLRVSSCSVDTANAAVERDIASAFRVCAQPPARVPSTAPASTEGASRGPAPVPSPAPAPAPAPAPMPSPISPVAALAPAPAAAPVLASSPDAPAHPESDVSDGENSEQSGDAGSSDSSGSAWEDT